MKECTLFITCIFLCIIIIFSGYGGEPGRVKVRKLIFTTKLSEKNKPTNRVEEITLAEKRIFLYLKCSGSKQEHVQLIKIFDGDSTIIYQGTKTFTPDKSRWQTWIYHNVNALVDKPGKWKFQIYFDGHLSAEEYLTVKKISG